MSRNPCHPTAPRDLTLVWAVALALLVVANIAYAVVASRECRARGGVLVRAVTLSGSACVRTTP